MSEPGLTRRRLLIAAVTLAAAVAAGPGVVAPLIERLAAGNPADLLRALITHGEGATYLGRRYLQAHPSEARSDVLVRRLVGTNSPTSEREASRAVAVRIRSDYAAGRTVKVDGWVLSRTEARLYALVAMG
jgi:hypothetical protein